MKITLKENEKLFLLFFFYEILSKIIHSLLIIYFDVLIIYCSTIDLLIDLTTFSQKKSKVPKWISYHGLVAYSLAASA